MIRQVTLGTLIDVANREVEEGSIYGPSQNLTEGLYVTKGTTVSSQGRPVLAGPSKTGQRGQRKMPNPSKKQKVCIKERSMGLIFFFFFLNPFPKFLANVSRDT